MVDELAGPLAYSTIWSWLLVASTAAPVAWWVIRRLVPGLTRGITGQSRSEVLRRRTLTVINGIEERYAEGIITSREAHVELSVAVRQCVSALSGIAVDVMTLADLENGTTERYRTIAAGRQQLVDAVRAFYSGAFEHRPSADVRVSARLAREVVSAWS